MRLAVITRLPPMKMAEADHALCLCQRLAGANVDVHVLTDVESISVSSPGLSISPIMRDWSWRDWPRMRRFLKTVAPDAVLLFYLGRMYHFHPMLTYAPTLVKKRAPQTRFVTQFSAPYGSGCWEGAWMTRLLRRLAHKWAGTVDVDLCFGTLLRDSDRIIVFSDSHRKKLAARLPAVNQKSVLIPPPPFLRMSSENADLHRRRVREQFQIGENDFLLAYFGYIYAGKGLETLLKSVQIAAKTHPQLRLLLIGGVPTWSAEARAYPEVLSNMAKELGIEGRLAWTGDYPWDSDLGSSYLRATDLCVLPFDWGVHLNNSSFSAAASHGLPILSTRAEYVEPAFVHEENVFLCPPKDPAAMAAAIERLADDAGLRLRLREGVRRMAQEWFSWERVIERTLATLTTDRTPEMTRPIAAERNGPCLVGRD